MAEQTAQPPFPPVQPTQPPFSVQTAQPPFPPVQPTQPPFPPVQPTQPPFPPVQPMPNHDLSQFLLSQHSSVVEVIAQLQQQVAELRTQKQHRRFEIGISKDGRYYIIDHREKETSWLSENPTQQDQIDKLQDQIGELNKHLQEKVNFFQSEIKELTPQIVKLNKTLTYQIKRLDEQIIRLDEQIKDQDTKLQAHIKQQDETFLRASSNSFQLPQPGNDEEFATAWSHFKSPPFSGFDPAVWERRYK
jgi:hypothetical protein